VGGILANGSIYRVNGSTDLMAVGQEVVVFGEIASYYGPEAVYVPAEAYWPNADANSIWIRQTDSYLIQGHAENVDERSLTLEQFKAKLAAVPAGE
jgi:hypothetical protein